jgi:hypothetical protein
MPEVFQMECKTIRAPSDSQKLVERLLLRQGWKILGSARGELFASIGSSFKIRMLGLPIAGENSYKRTMRISFEELEKGCVVKIRVEDAMGVGSRAGIADRVRRILFSDASSIKEELFDQQEIGQVRDVQ